MVEESKKPNWKLFIYGGYTTILLSVILLFYLNATEKIEENQYLQIKRGLVILIVVGIYLVFRGRIKRQQCEEYDIYKTIDEYKRKGYVLASIIILIAYHSGINRNDIWIESDIERDLGITGDDALELILEFGKVYNVDVSGFMAANYFEAEGYNFLMPELGERKSLRVGHLVTAVKFGKLDEDIIAKPYVDYVTT